MSLNSSSESLTKNEWSIYLYVIIEVIGVLGNFFLLYSIAKVKKIRTTTNKLIANMAFSDLLLSLTYVPFDYTRFTLNNWIFGEFTCKSLLMVKISSQYVSAFSMTIIAIDRYMVIVKQGYRRIFGRVPPSVVCGLIWILSVVLTYPYSHIAYTFIRPHSSGYKQCNLRFPKPPYNVALALFKVLTIYFIPLAITGCAYAYLGFFLMKRKVIGSASEARQVRLEKSKKKALRMVAFITGIEV